MELEQFVNKIKEILIDNGIESFYTNIGHIQPISGTQAILYFTKDLIIWFNGENCVVNIQFSLVDGKYGLKEMTININGEKYGYKHCKMLHKSSNKITEFPLDTELNENTLDDIINYLIILVKYNNDLEALKNIWKKSLTRSTFKKKYPLFHIDRTSYVDQNRYHELNNKFNCIEAFNEHIFFFNDNQIEFKYVEED